MTAAMAAVVNLRNGSLMTARLVHGYANRKLKELDEANGHRSYGWWEEDARLRPAPPPPAARSEALPDLHELKVTMAAAHPDRGGSNAAFIEARKRYIAARRALRPQRSPCD